MAGSRPSPSEVRAVVDALAALHGRPNREDHGNGLQPGCELREPHTVLDSLVRTILSQNTTDVTSQRAYTSLKQAFPTWDGVRTAPPGALADAIRVGGLADIKASRIQAILESLLQERGELSLEHLRAMPCEEVKAYLRRYKGVGPKSIACVMLFCLGRHEMAVDTHVWEISKQLGWVPATASREAAYELLNARVPDESKYELHVLLVEHGKRCPQCAKRPGGKQRGGNAAKAGAPACPLATFKRGKGAAVAAPEPALAPAAAGVAVKQEELQEAAASPAAATAAAAAAVVKLEPASSPATLAADVKVEASSSEAAAPHEAKQRSPARKRSRTSVERRGNA